MSIPITPIRQRIIDVLAGGSIEDPDGQATSALMKRTGHKTTNALSGVLMELEKGGVIKRDAAGRRTYRIALTPAGKRLVSQAPGTQVSYDDPGDLDILELLKDAAAAVATRDARIQELEAELAELRAQADRTARQQMRSPVKQREIEVLAQQLRAKV